MHILFIKHRNLVILAAYIFLGLTMLIVGSGNMVFAQDEAQTACTGIEAAGGSCDGGEDQLANVIRGVIQVLLFVVGVAAVIMLVVGGIRYVVSGGDQQAVAAAKNTIIYSIVGIVVALLSWAAVDWVFGLISGGENGGGGGGGGAQAE